MKLNRKGFTLIELLAIIVILAIIMVVTIPTVLGSLGDARQSTFDSSANTVADYIEKQYTLYLMNPNDTTLNSNLKTNCYSGGCKEAAVGITGSLKAAGVDPTNYASATAQIDNSGRVCVILEASTADGTDFNSVERKTAKSTGCSS